MSKTLNLDQASELANILRSQGEKIGVTGGFFDLLHVGHIRCLKSGHRYCDKLFVYVLNDDSAKFVKGEGRPIIPFAERIEALAALECVDIVIGLEAVYRSPTFGRDDLDILVLNALKPNVYIRSPDCITEKLTSLAQHRGVQLVVHPSYMYQSTTKIIQKITRNQLSTQNAVQPMTNVAYMQLAIEEANKSNYTSRRDGAVLVVDGRVVARGRNQVINPYTLTKKLCQSQKLTPSSRNSEQLESCCFIHAEQDMFIQAASERVLWHKGVVYVTAAPCKICAGMLAHAGIEKLFYLRFYSSEGLYLLNSYNITTIQLTLNQSLP